VGVCCYLYNINEARVLSVFLRLQPPYQCPFSPGKDADAREDPNKYYLLDPSELTNSPHLGAPNTLEPPNARPYRRPGTSPRKTAAHTAPSTTEAYGDGISLPSQLTHHKHDTQGTSHNPHFGSENGSYSLPCG